MNILIVEDDPGMRELVCQTLREIPGANIMAACNDFDTCKAVLEKACPDVLLVDLCLPRGGDGLTLIRRARFVWGARCLSAVLTAHRKEEFLIDAIRGGAKGFIDKSLAPEQWKMAIQALAMGESPLNAGLARIFEKELFGRPPECTQPFHRKLFDFFRQVGNGSEFGELAAYPGLTAREAGLLARYAYDALETSCTLSPRELEYLNLLNAELSPQERAESMCLPASTLKTYGQRICVKLNVKTQFEAIIEARRQGFIP